MGLYHKDVFLPKVLIDQCPALYSVKLDCVEHFFDRSAGLLEKYAVSESKFKGVIDEIKETHPTPFEVETDKDKKVVKCVIRYSYDEFRDICIVFRKGKIITFWFNNVNDNHLTLDTSKYDKTL